MTEVVPPPSPAHATVARPAERVRLVCLDDDAQGRDLEVFWPLELGARVIEPSAEGLGTVTRLDDPAQFGAYLNALRWNAISATDNALFQAPFRAGIQLMNHQIPPLSKALALPRANLFIADDVGLGKTIEAGLVLQELILRQQVERVLIVAPAAITLQWRAEMEQRFGQRFEIMNRAFVARCRRERGFAVNPWATHSRFIVSYQTLRRPEYLEPLLTQLGDRARRSLLILDEAHTVAPATSSRYAVDSNVTRTVRDLAGRFDNRLFLSATPHNGHSNSFSALLEILDSARFTRGVPIDDPAQLEPVLIRRLKSDLKALGENYPDRHIIRIALEGVADPASDASNWRAAFHVNDASPTRLALGPAHDAELRLAELLAEYTALAEPRHARGRLVFVSLQKRLLSSLEAFHRTLAAHTRWLGDNPASDAAQLHLAATDTDEEAYGLSDDTLDLDEADDIAAASQAFSDPSAELRRLLEAMRALTARYRHAPSPKVVALRHWLATHCCPAIAHAGVPDAPRLTPADRAWTNRRVIIFTEYGDTKRYLRDQLREAIAGTPHAEERIVEIHGGMDDEARADVQERFNDPTSHARILLATDAAREGVNLQGACADLFHFDIPWNPARLEQRNGRIDRTGQSEPVVRCHYFTYSQRAEDRVLDVLVRKVEVIQRELGSLGAVVLDRIESTLEHGIKADAADRLDQVEAELDRHVDRRGTANRELESSRELKRLKAEIDQAGRHLQRSRERVGVDPDALRAAIEVGLRLAGADPLVPVTVTGRDKAPITAYTVPADKLPGWERTLDTLRRPRRNGEDFWEWRKEPLRPVVFAPTAGMGEPVVHLHLEHPFAKRALSRFRSQGFGQSDLSRASIVTVPGLHEPRVVAFARLSLFGQGARRLHDELVAVAAPWSETAGATGFTALDEADVARTLLRLDEALVASATDPARFPERQAARLAASAARDFAVLWPTLDAEADARAAAAAVDLETRGRKDAEALAAILGRQKVAIDKRIQQLSLDLGDQDYARDERIQARRDQEHMVNRRKALDVEAVEEPQAIRALFDITLRRVTPVGLVYLWPETRA
ncbi:MAG: DEAD/DEAH box helicase [Deltaproteobacteria bacterium]|nr:DEAD/DEAH box helicase [Deltaproteobacteria bacterium]